MKSQDIVITHTFHAAVGQVWQLLTDETFVRCWWYVDGFSNILAKMDVREGGLSHLGMRASKEYGGQDYYNVWKYTKVIPNKIIQYISNFADKDGNVISPEIVGLPAETPMDKKQQFEFKDFGNGKTGITITEFGWRADGVMIERSKRGLKQILANMENVLSGQE